MPNSETQKWTYPSAEILFIRTEFQTHKLLIENLSLSSVVYESRPVKIKSKRTILKLADTSDDCITEWTGLSVLSFYVALQNTISTETSSWENKWRSFQILSLFQYSYIINSASVNNSFYLSNIGDTYATFTVTGVVNKQCICLHITYVWRKWTSTHEEQCGTFFNCVINSWCCYC